ncbi:HD-GYP domain-containing protein [Chloroflexales bacterium ZM16-3]|nr:HD-GYP domain-containing protein [Chloroflexales bacterium ZM16-3]
MSELRVLRALGQVRTRLLSRLHCVAGVVAASALEEAYDATLVALAYALALRDNETAAHSARVTDLTMVLAAGWPFTAAERTHMRRGAVLHDIGKIGVPDAILQKPGKLTDDEWIVMRQHPLLAVKVLEHIAFLQPALTIPRWHHERWDGSGYPDGLAGKDIPLEARIFAVVDVWDAITNERPYHAAESPEAAMRYLRAQAGLRFDPAVIAQFGLLVGAPACAAARDRAAA